MQFYTITERRDDPRITAFALFARLSKATQVLVFTRPEHVSPDPAKFQIVAAAAEASRTAALNAATLLDLTAAATHKEDMERFQNELRQMQADASKWLTDALQQTGAPAASHFITVPHENWSQDYPWTTANFSTRLVEIETSGIAGITFTTPLTSRVFVPLAVFNTAIPSTAASSAPVPQVSTEETPNRPSTAPTHVDTSAYGPYYQPILDALPNEGQKKHLVTLLGLDRTPPKPRSPKEAATALGISPQSFPLLLGKVRASLTAAGHDMDVIVQSAGPLPVEEPVLDPAS